MITPRAKRLSRRGIRLVGFFLIELLIGFGLEEPNYNDWVLINTAESAGSLCIAREKIIREGLQVPLYLGKAVRKTVSTGRKIYIEK